MAKDIKLIACRNCGKEIRADTKYCPFCSVENIDVRTNEADVHHPNKTHTVPVPKTVPINKEETKPLPTENADAESLPKEENLTCSGTSKKEMDKSYKKKKSKKNKKSNFPKEPLHDRSCRMHGCFFLRSFSYGCRNWCVLCHKSGNQRSYFANRKGGKL